jgi:hypothetical protein
MPMRAASAIVATGRGIGLCRGFNTGDLGDDLSFSMNAARSFRRLVRASSSGTAMGCDIAIPFGSGDQTYSGKILNTDITRSSRSC